jgi:Phage baseplate assembly protein W
MVYKINPMDMTAVTLSEQDRTQSILQNISIIIQTRQQSVPLYRNFGLPMRFLDKPVQAARTMIIAEIQEAITEFEPRAALLGVTFETDESAPGVLVPILEVEINEQ